ncbi:MAG: phosphoribosylanthranilate isomerase [Nitrospirae bacterium]|nr:phosphoribosylanthranilate isomerase [Nitrospirota bacterium]
MVKVKICGITSLNDALACVKYGADAIGFILYNKSPRYITPEKIAHIIKRLPPFIQTVGVFVNVEPDIIKGILRDTGLNIAQLHGDETPDICELFPRVIKAFRVRDIADIEDISKYRASAFLLDTYSVNAYGGTGKKFDWDIVEEAKGFGNVIVAGGLTPENVSDVIFQVNPYGVDVSTGVEESPGVKDHGRIKEFIEQVKTKYKGSRGIHPLAGV